MEQLETRLQGSEHEVCLKLTAGLEEVASLLRLNQIWSSIRDPSASQSPY